MINYQYLDSDSKLLSYLDSLRERKVERIAVDLEGEFNLHCYGEHLCLVQIFDGRDYALIDPVKVRISLIRDLMENRDIAKIMYDCSGDRTLLFRKYGIVIKSIEDLLPAAELLDLEKRNLGFMLTHFLGVQPKAKKKFQQYNWMRRPLHPEALQYALEDVKYLFDLKTAVLKEVASAGLMKEYEEKNREAQSREISLNPTPGVFKKNRFKKMPAPSRTVFRELFEIRDGYAERLDLPPNSVVPNESLFHLSSGDMFAGEIRFNGRIPSGVRTEIISEYKSVLKSANLF